MSVPRDLNVTLSYLTAHEATRHGIANAQPGFYIKATDNGGYGTVIELTRVDDYAEVERIAAAFDRALPGVRTPIRLAVRNVRTQHQRDAIERRRAAEKAIADARATLAALDAEADA